MKSQLSAGKFEIQGEIAIGQTGVVYHGYDFERRQEVAIKIFHSQINGKRLRGRPFVDKSLPLVRLDHPNLIKLYKVEEHDERPVVFMELFDAPSLQRIIREQGPLSLKRMLLLARELTKVLVHTQAQGIIHGTLHPGHVLVGPENRIKVLDLGTSWILLDLLSHCPVDLLRPLPYMPPEIAKGELLNVSSDVYCLGLMMYDMLKQRLPYTGLPKTSIMGKLAFDQTDPEFDFPQDIPQTISGLIRDMTRNRSEHRLQDASHVLSVLDQQLKDMASETEHLSGSTIPIPAVKEAEGSVEGPQNTRPSAQSPGSPIGRASEKKGQQATTNLATTPGTMPNRRFGVYVSILVLITAAIMGWWYWDLLKLL